jgi:hypothetical protein
MKRLTLIAAAALTALAFAGCGTQVITTTTAGTPPAVSTTTTHATPSAAHIGGMISLTGRSNTMDVAMLKIVSIPPGEFATPASGNRYVGVTYRLTNAGTSAYSDSPSNGIKLVLADDSQSDAAAGIPTTPECDWTASASMAIAPGASRRGCAAFEIPIAQDPKAIQFTLDSGFADQTGEWTIH